MKQSKAERFLEAFTDIDEKFIKEAMNYTMKKRFNFKPIVAIAACAAIALAAIPVVNNFVNTTPAVQGVEKIGENGNFTVYESGVHAGQILGTHKIEIELNNTREEYIDNKKIGTKETIVLLGQTWNAKYNSSKTETDLRNVVHVYEGVSNGKKVAFGIDSVTGKCEHFIFKNSGDIDKTIKLSRDELYNIAYDNFMNGGYTDDPENYQLSDENSNGTAGYWFKFSRFVDGIETSDYVRIGLRNNGDFYWYIGNDIGEMKDIDVSAIDMDKVYDALETKFKTIYADDYVGFEKGGVVLTKLNDGSYIFDCSIDAIVKDGNGKAVKDTCFFAVTID